MLGKTKAMVKVPPCVHFLFININLSTQHQSNLFPLSRNINYNCWRSEIQFWILQTVKRILLLKIFCPVKVYTLSKPLLPVTTAECNLFIASSTSCADRYLLFLCHWQILFYIKRFQSWPKKQKLNKMGFSSPS